jgi:hypothetical protein
MQRKQPKYEKGIELWRCPDCGEWLPKSQFYNDKRTFNGITSECKKCHIKCAIRTRNEITKRDSNKNYMRRDRLKNPNKLKEAEKIRSRKRIKDKKHYARVILNTAIKAGILIKPSICEKCSLPKRITGHHTDYDKPLSVEWLCYECHAKEHIL